MVCFLDNLCARQHLIVNLYIINNIFIKMQSMCKPNLTVHSFKTYMIDDLAIFCKFFLTITFLKLRNKILILTKI